MIFIKMYMNGSLHFCKKIFTPFYSISSKRNLLVDRYSNFFPDFDECATGQYCGANSICTNTISSFQCSCKSGYTGDGIVCVKKAPDGMFILSFFLKCRLSWPIDCKHATTGDLRGDRQEITEEFLIRKIKSCTLFSSVLYWEVILDSHKHKQWTWHTGT